jgi:hypothetical protein
VRSKSGVVWFGVELLLQSPGFGRGVGGRRSAVAALNAVTAKRRYNRDKTARARRVATCFYLYSRSFLCSFDRTPFAPASYTYHLATTLLTHAFHRPSSHDTPNSCLRTTNTLTAAHHTTRTCASANIPHPHSSHYCLLQLGTECHILPHGLGTCGAASSTRYVLPRSDSLRLWHVGFVETGLLQKR